MRDWRNNWEVIQNFRKQLIEARQKYANKKLVFNKTKELEKKLYDIKKRQNELALKKELNEKEKEERDNNCNEISKIHDKLDFYADIASKRQSGLSWLEIQYEFLKKAGDLSQYFYRDLIRPECELDVSYIVKEGKKFQDEYEEFMELWDEERDTTEFDNDDA